MKLSGEKQYERSSSLSGWSCWYFTAGKDNRVVSYVSDVNVLYTLLLNKFKSQISLAKYFAATHTSYLSVQTLNNGCNSKPEDQTRPLFHKKNSWTNLATKARRLSSRRRTSSTFSSTKTPKETTNNVNRTNPNYEKGLEVRII